MPLLPYPQDLTVRSITFDSNIDGSGTEFRMDAGTASALGTGGATYNVLANGLVADGVTSNNAALLALVAEVVGEGGGTIYFPSGDYFFGIDYNGALSPANRSVYLRDQGRMNVRFLGDGPSSRLIWGGNAGQGGGGGGAAHFFYLRGQTSHVTFESLKIVQTTLTNPDPGAEQHHLIRLQADVTGNCQHIKVLNCEFGLVKGDAINMSGGFDQTAIKVDVAANASSGAIGGLSNTSPDNLLPGEGQRVCVEFSSGWDGGSFTFTGTEYNGRVISETITKQNPGLDNVAGYREFTTITGITYSGGGTTGTADLGWCYVVQYVDVVGCRFNGFEQYNASHTYGYRSAIGVQRLSCYINVIRNWMTGCDDQLIDFEPTGNGYLGPWIIEYNTFVCAAAATLGGSDTACSFFGNANKFPCHRSSISHNNMVGGGVLGGKLDQCDIIGNHIWIPEDARLILQFTDRMEDVRIQGNTVEALGPNVGDVTAPCISMVGGGSTTVPDSPRGCQILDNVLHWYALAAPNQQPAIRVPVSTDTVIARNTIINHGTASAVDVAAIKCEKPVIAISNFRVDSNTIEGGRGGGSIQRGVDFSDRATTAWKNVSICSNMGTGVSATGVNLRDPDTGSFSNPASVYGNRFPDATNSVVLGSGVVVLVGGNGGNSAGQYVSAATDPATDTELDNVGIGSTYQSTGAGGNLYLKTAAGSAGWKLVTHA